MFCGYPRYLDVSFIYNDIGLYFVLYCDKAIYNPSDKNVNTKESWIYFNHTFLRCSIVYYEGILFYL